MLGVLLLLWTATVTAVNSRGIPAVRISITVTITRGWICGLLIAECRRCPSRISSAQGLQQVTAIVNEVIQSPLNTGVIKVDVSRCRRLNSWSHLLRRRGLLYNSRRAGRGRLPNHAQDSLLQLLL